MRVRFARAYQLACVQEDDVAADGALLVEEMQAQRRMFLRQIGEHGGDGIAVRLEPALAAHHAAQHRRQLHPHAHVATTSTLWMRGSPLASSRQLSPRSRLP